MSSYQRNNNSERFDNKRKSNIKRAPKRDPIFVDGHQPRPMYVRLQRSRSAAQLTNRPRPVFVSRRKTGLTTPLASTPSRGRSRRARFMALLPFVGD